MQNLLLVAAGGAIGASARYAFSGAVLRAVGPGWPWGTFAINIVGSLAIGVLAGWLALRGEGGAPWKLLIGTGVLGGFTTFSAYSLEAVQLIEQRQYAPAAAYAIGSVIVGLVAAFIGLWIARRVWS